MDLSKLGKPKKREERSEVRSAKRTEKRGEGREKIEKNVEASNLKISAETIIRMSSQTSGV